DAQLAELARAGSTAFSATGQSVFREGDRADCMYVIVSGRVRVTRGEPGDDEVELWTLGPGSVFGELALFDGGGRSANVTAIEPCEFFVLAREPFIALLDGSTQLLSSVLADVSGKIRAANEKMFSEWLQKRMLRTEMELRRHRSIAEMVAGV